MTLLSILVGKITFDQISGKYKSSKFYLTKKLLTKGFLWANSKFFALTTLKPKIWSLPSETPWWTISGQIKFF